MNGLNKKLVICLRINTAKMESFSCIHHFKNIYIWSTAFQSMANDVITLNVKQWTQDFLQKYFSKKQYHGYLLVAIIVQTFGVLMEVLDYHMAERVVMVLMVLNFKNGVPDYLIYLSILIVVKWTSKHGFVKKMVQKTYKKNGYLLRHSLG